MSKFKNLPERKKQKMTDRKENDLSYMIDIQYTYFEANISG